MSQKIIVLVFTAIVAISVVAKYDNVWLQKNNVKYLVESNQASRVFPHRVNSVGKLKDIWNAGFRSFELDAHFVLGNPGYFAVGHDEGRLGRSLEKLLGSVSIAETQRIWLDLKNLGVENYSEVLARLNSLDNKFNLRDKLILESGIASNFLEQFGNEGWYTAYYLTPNRVSDLLLANNTKELHKLALNIVQQSTTQNVSAISFNSKLYSFVKEYVEPVIAEKIDYHTWWGPKLYRYSFRERLHKLDAYLDDRVKSILVQYKCNCSDP